MELHHLAFRTEEPERLAAFYEQLLGMRRVPPPPQSTSVWLALGAAVLMIERRAPGEPACDRRSKELVAWAVHEEGRRAIRERLAAAGVPLEGETRHTTYFRDPDGRRVAVSTYPLPAPQ